MIARALRTFDGIAYTTVVLLLLALVPGAGTDPLGRPTLIFAAPAIAMVWFSWRLPAELCGAPLWGAVRRRLVVTAMAFAGLMPFVIWWYETPGSLYLLVNAVLAVYAGILFLYHLAIAAMVLGKEWQDGKLIRLALAAKHGLLYVFFCAFSALAIAVLIQAALLNLSALEALNGLSIQPYFLGAVGCWLVLVCLAGILVPLRVSHLLEHKPCERAEGDRECPPLNLS